MDDLRNSLFRVATGDLKDPTLTITVDGMDHEFIGKEAKVLAFGMLLGMKAEKDGCPVDVFVTEMDEGAK